MKKNSLFIYSVLLLLFGCNSNEQSQFYSYIESSCTFETNDTCYVDLKSFFKVDYDTMYVFGEYTQLEGIRLILGIKDYQSSNVMMSKGFLVEDSYNKIILLKDHKVVFDVDVKNPYFYNDGVEVKKIGVFDNEPYLHYGKIFTTSKFLVIRKGNKNDYYYICRNVLSDGSLMPFETIE